MAIIKKFKIYTFLLAGIIFLSSAIALSSGKIRVFDFKYEAFNFFNGGVVVELPDKPKSNHVDGKYYKVLMDEYIDLTLGRADMSTVEVNKYKGPREDKFKNKLELVSKRTVESDTLSIHRMAFWHGENPVVLSVDTLVFKDTFPTEDEKQQRLQKDDKIFEHIVESFRYRKEDGTYAKPEIIRQKEEVKEIEFHGSEYHGN